MIRSILHIVFLASPLLGLSFYGDGFTRGIVFEVVTDGESFVVEEGSRFWIEGTTTVNSFTCEAPYVAGFGTVEAVEGETEVEAVVAVPVRAFDCGVRQMNRDLYDVLRGKEHPGIRFALDGAEALGLPDADGWAELRAWGTLTLAGTERAVTVMAQGRRFDDGRAELRGTHALRMTDFDIDPPRGPLGLIRAHNDITVRFDLVASATDSN